MAVSSQPRRSRAKPASPVPGRSPAGASGERGIRALWPAAALGLVALTLALWSAVDLSRDWRINDPVMDGLHYLTTATRLSQGAGWPPGPHFMTPFYPFVLSLVFRLASPGVPTVQGFQIILGLCTLLLLFRAARRDLGTAAAWILAGLFVLCAPILEVESEVLTEGLLLFLAAAALYLWPAGRRPSWRELLFGLVCGCLTIGRGVFLLLPAAAVLHLAWAGRNEPPKWQAGTRSAALIAAGVLIALLPVAVRQTRTTGHLTFLTLNGGMNLYIGNNPVARGIFSAPPEIDLENDFTAARSASFLAGRALSLRESSAFWTARALAFMRDQPGRFLWLAGRKALLFLSPREIPQLEDFQLQRAAWTPLRIAFVDFAWILPLAALGLAAVLWPGGPLRGRSDRLPNGPGHRPPRLAPWLILIGAGWISTILFFATGRYRIPFLAGFLGVAALGAQAAWEMIRVRRLHLVAAVLPVAVAVQWALPGYPIDQARAHDAFQHGGYLLRHGEPAAALESYREGTRLAPQDGACWHGAGVALVRLGRMQEAAQAYEQACRWLPTSAASHYDLGAVYGRMGDDARATGELQEAVRLDPLDPRFGSDLAVAYARSGRREEAVRLLRQIVQRNPEYIFARRNLEALGVK